MQLFSVFGKIGLDDADFNRGIASAESSGRGLGSVMADVGKAVAAAAAAMGAALVGVGVAAAKTGDVFNQELGAIRAQTGQAVEDIQLTERAVRDLAMEQGRFSANEMISALASVSRHGQDSEHQLMLVENAMRLSNATGEDFTSSMYRLDALMVKFSKDTMEDAVKFTNMFATAQGIAGVSNASLLEGLQRSAGITNNAGLAYDFVAAALTRAYQGGMSMAVASTGLSTIFGDMLDVSSNVREVMDDLGVVVTRNRDGSIDYQTSLTTLVNRMQRLDYDTRAATLAQIGWNGSAANMFNVLKNETRYVDELSSAFRRGMFWGESYDRVLNMIEARGTSLSDFFGLIRNSFAEFNKTVWEFIEIPVMDAFGAITGKLSSITQTFAPLFGRAIGNLVGILTGAEGASDKFAESIGNIANEINRQLPVFLQRGIDIVVSLITGVASALPTLVQGVVEIVPTVARTILDAIPELITAGIKVVVALINGISTMLPELVPIAIEGIITIVNAILDNLPLLLDAAIGLIGALAKALADPRNLVLLANAAPQLIAFLALWLGKKAGLAPLAGAGAAIVGKLAGKIKASKLAMVLSGKALAKAMAGGVKAGGKGATAAGVAVAGKAAKGMGTGKAGAKAAGLGIGKAFKHQLVELGKDMKFVGGGISKAFGKALKGGKSIMSKAGGGIASAFTGAVKGVGAGAKAGKGLLAAIGPKGWIAGGIAVLGTVAFANRDKIGEFFGRMGDSAREAASNVWEATKGAAENVGEFFRNVGTSVRDGASNIVGNAREMAQNTVRNARDAFQSARDVGAEFINGITNGIGSTAQSLFSSVMNVTRNVIDGARNAISNFKDIGRAMMEGMQNGISSAASRVAESARNVANSAINGVRNVLGINSPSTVFVDIGENMGESTAIGWYRKAGSIYKALDETFSDISKYGSSPSVIASVSGSGAGVMAQSSRAGVFIEKVVIDAKNVKDFNDVVELFSGFEHDMIVYGGCS